jgi:hypothetical protein
MKQLLTVLAFVIVVFATAATLTHVPNRKLNVADSESIKSDTVMISGDTVSFDTLKLHLKQVPRAQHLYTVAKHSVGKWAKLFVVIKIEESGADGQNSFYAKKYFNLTGMRFPGTGRKTTAVKAGRDYYAVFNHWHDCMVDFKMYMDVMDEKFEKKFGRPAKDEFEMVDFMFGSFNPYGVWKRDVYWLLKHFNYK